MAYSIHEEAALRERGIEVLKTGMAEQDTAKAHIQRFLLYPPMWEQIPLLHDLQWHSVKFLQENKSAVESKRGVYTFSVQMEGHMVPPSGYVMYVGKASNLRRRYNEYFREKEYKYDSHRYHIACLLSRWVNYIYFNFSYIKDETSEADIEKVLINGMQPPFNRSSFEGILGISRREAFQ